MARFRTGQYGPRQGGDTGTAPYAVRRGDWYRTVMSGTTQYASVLYPSYLDLVHHAWQYSVQVGTVRGEAAIPVLHGTQLGGDTGIVL